MVSFVSPVALRNMLTQINRQQFKQFLEVLKAGNSCSIHYCRKSMAVESFNLESVQNKPMAICRTLEGDPKNHKLSQEGLYYTIPEDIVKSVYYKALPADFRQLTGTFNETCLMIRKPALEVIDFLKNLNMSHMVPRFLLYGDSGHGKTLSLAHIMHYCSQERWLILHCHWPVFWNKRNLIEVLPSSRSSERIDIPSEAVEWLLNFRSQNVQFLTLTLDNEYVWSKRDISRVGCSFGEIVELGLNRSKFACDVIGVILKEVRLQASQHKFKALVVIDGVNAFWSRTLFKDQNGNNIPSGNVSLVHNFKKMLLPTWVNGAVVCTVDLMAEYRPEMREHCTPHYLLGKEGFLFMDPFVPVSVPCYSEKEAYSCLAYYYDRNWIQHEAGQSEEAMKELLFISASNPSQMMKLAASR